VTPIDDTEEVDAGPVGQRRIGRRGFIAGGIVVAGLAAVGIKLATSDDSSEPTGSNSGDRAEPAPAEQVQPSPDRVTQIQALGARYRELEPEATTPEALGALPSINSVDDVEAAFRRDRSLIRDDYASGQVVTIDGWRIAAREALLAAQASAL
jgi:hypothetical protein